MYKAYRGCPVCRNNLTELRRQQVAGQLWTVYTCDNCGSEIWVDPFKGVKKDHSNGLFSFLR